MVKKLLFTLFLVFIQTTVFALNTYIGPNNGDWNTASNWSLGNVPSESDDVVIPAGKTVTISADSVAKSVSIFGILKVDDGRRLTVYNDLTVNSGGSFLMPTGSALATLVVYGNYINNGLTDFWKSNVVIAGDLLSPTTSTLQKQGNVVVGGNIIGNFDTTGGNGDGQIYAVNPNATVTITPSTIDNVVVPGTTVTVAVETQTLVDLVNLIIFGGNCTFTVDGTQNQTVCSGSNAVFTVGTNQASPSYQWQVKTAAPGWSDLVNDGTYSGVGTATLTISNVTDGMNNYQYRAKVSGGAPLCTRNGNSGVLIVNPLPTITGTFSFCIGTTTTLTGSATPATIDPWVSSNQSVATISNIGVVTGVSAGTSVISYKNNNGCIRTQTVTVLENTASAASSTPIVCINTALTNITHTTTLATGIGTTTGLPSGVAASWESNAITISGTPTESGTFNYSILLTGGCGNVNATGTITVTPNNTVGAASSSPAVCINTAMTNITHITTGAGGIGAVAGLPSGVTATLTSNTVTISGIPTESGTFNYSIPLTGGCGNVNATGTIFVNPETATPTVGTITDVTCISYGSVVLNGLPSGSWTITQTGASLNSYVGSTTSYTVTGLPVGDYAFAVTNSAGCISQTTPVSIIATSTTKWNGSSWDSGLPTLAKAAIIAGNYDTASNPDIEACSLTINSGVTLTIRDTKFMTIQNHLIVNTGATLEIENQGSLVMISDAGNVINNGTINVNKTTAPFEQYDYTYWSSPLSGSTSIATTFPTWRRAYEFHPENFIDADDDGFDDNGNDWIRISAMTTPGKGCIIMGPTTGTFPRTESVVFRGTVNNGVVSTTVRLSPGTDPDDDYNLVGNPYPSAISADAFILANISPGGSVNQTIDGTLYFWTHVDDASVLNPGPDAYNYTADDYAMYNLSGGVGTGVGTGSTSGSDAPSGYIASGQGFLVGALVDNGTLTFNNSMRVGNLPNTQFFKTQAVKAKSKAVEKDRFWLNLQNANGMFSQQLVGYFDKATAGYDNGYDGLLSDAGNFVNFYSFINDTAYKIQGREAFNTDDEVRLGYFSSVAGTFNINIDSKEGVFTASETPIYLEDKVLGIIHDLKEAPYSFETEKGSFDDRFVLRYNNTNKTLGTDESKISENKVIVSVKERQLKINSFEETIDKVWVYDLLGRQIFTKEKVDSSEFVISNLVSAKQTLIVKVLLQNGQIYTDKVVY